MSTAVQLQEKLRTLVNITVDRQLYFFKTGPGSYAEHEQFLGVRTPALRSLAREFSDLPLADLQILLDSPFNEERQVALFVLMAQYRKAYGPAKEELYRFYMSNLARVNNWNLVDSSAHNIVGEYLFTQSDRAILAGLAQSPVLWERRIAVVATWFFIKKGDFAWTLRLAKDLLGDPHDLMHKAVGWMLREVGGKDEQALRSFLEENAARMPRTMLRYAIEKLPEEDRVYYRMKR